MFHSNMSRNKLKVYKTCGNASLEEHFLGNFALKLKSCAGKVENLWTKCRLLMKTVEDDPNLFQCETQNAGLCWGHFSLFF